MKPFEDQYKWFLCGRVNEIIEQGPNASLLSAVQMDRFCECDTLSFLTKKAQGQKSRTSGEVIHLKVIFTETGERWTERRGIQPYQEWWLDDGWNKQTETSIKNKWKYLISPLTDWIYIARVCCLVTSHCPAHFQMLIRSETINKSMAAGCQTWLFPGDEGERGVGTLVCSGEVDLNRDVTAISNTSVGLFKGIGLVSQVRGD